ncbi:VanZ family protein [Companilactobacillus ginsenosidimutans]|uniref:Membrane protein n=1 Tax=Companilactobacillus ginsenosidimutans TaxID=1007676 RepID=A0A0H4QMD0_9LACO|nr:VanZ family protein [Companilactobacillus ginsenosidimutans]AKP68266.1 membrane protein [Companilactobacillus ginsenosidimutans]
MDRKLKLQEKWYWIGAAVVELILFISSSMTYKQQTSIPFLERHLGSNSRPFYSLLKGIGFQYGDKYQSMKNDGYFNFLEFFIRKGAHFGTYFVLGILLCLALYTYFKGNVALKIFIPWMVATGLAAFDEFHQGLTGGRSPMVEDVILDSVGALTAILITLLILIFIKKHQKKHHPFSMEY